MYKALTLIALIALPAHSALAAYSPDYLGDDARTDDDSSGAINPSTGEYYPAAGPSGVIDTETGAFYPKAGPEGFTDPKTGQYYPAQ